MSSDLNELLAQLPKAVAWVESQEAGILLHGVALNEAQLAAAREIGVGEPERVRLMEVDSIPVPEDPALQALCRKHEIITEQTFGLSCRYGIYLRAGYLDHLPMIAHELKHTEQYERLGGIAGFLTRYLTECLEYGYSHAPLEKEAQEVGNRYHQRPGGSGTARDSSG